MRAVEDADFAGIQSAFIMPALAGIAILNRGIQRAKKRINSRAVLIGVNKDNCAGQIFWLQHLALPGKIIIPLLDKPGAPNDIGILTAIIR